jgi:hypothetical protein
MSSKQDNTHVPVPAVFLPISLPLGAFSVSRSFAASLPGFLKGSLIKKKFYFFLPAPMVAQSFVASLSGIS